MMKKKMNHVVMMRESDGSLSIKVASFAFPVLLNHFWFLVG